MALNIFGTGDPIDYNVLNGLIRELNRLEDSNNVQAFYNWNSSFVQDSFGNKIAVLAWRVVVPVPASSFYNGAIKTLSYPNGVSFSEPPVITVTSDDTNGASGSSYIVPYVKNVTGTGFVFGALRASNIWAPLPSTIAANIIAIGPTNRSYG